MGAWRGLGRLWRRASPRRTGRRAPSRRAQAARAQAARIEPVWIDPRPDELAALRRLPPEERAAFLLRDVYGFGPAEAAWILDRSVRAVNEMAERARTGMARFRPSRTPPDARSDPDGPGNPDGPALNLNRAGRRG